MNTNETTATTPDTIPQDPSLDAGGAAADADKTSAQPDYQAAELQNLASGTGGETTPKANEVDINLDVILDVPVTISVEIGRSQIPVRQLLQYNQGSVVELDRHVGEPMNVLVNNTLIAHGEIVMIDDQFGIRLTDVISPSERVKKLR
ncbi:MAG: flagellar motor switch protein FliN [Porticoccaceae bacterium]|nr:flagellar motor switch protein FliN [Porticoccaceae bacterium]